MNNVIAQWAVVPDIRHWRGDQRRNHAPYMLTGGLSYGCLNWAQWAARELRARKIACYVEIIN